MRTECWNSHAGNFMAPAKAGGAENADGQTREHKMQVRFVIPNPQHRAGDELHTRSAENELKARTRALRLSAARDKRPPCERALSRPRVAISARDGNPLEWKGEGR